MEKMAWYKRRASFSGGRFFEVQQLLLDDSGVMSWTLFYPERTSIVLYEDEGNHRQFLQRTVFHVRAENSSKSFDEFLEFPGTPMTRTDECFLQWKEREKGTVWGLKFCNATDLEGFLRVCLSGLSTGRVSHTTSTQALADAIDGPTTRDTRWTSNSSLRRPASVVESNIDGGSHGVAESTQLPSPTEISEPIEEHTAPLHVDSTEEGVGNAIMNNRQITGDGTLGEEEEPECSYIDGIEPPSQRPVQLDLTRTDSQPATLSDVGISPVEPIPLDIQSPSDSILGNSGTLNRLSLSLTNDVLSQFPVTIVAQVSDEQPLSTGPVHVSGSFDPSSLAAPPQGFLHSTENLHGNDDDVSDELASPPAPPLWVESGLTQSNVEAAASAAHVQDTHEMSSSVTPSTSHEALRGYSPGIVPVQHHENQDSGFAGSDYPDIQAEVGEVAAMPSVAALRNTFGGGPASSVATTEGTGSVLSSDQDLEESHGSGNEASAEDAATANEVQGRRLSRTRSKSDRHSVLLNGSTRRAGWLELKNVLYHKNGRLAPASRRKWKKCWGVLRDTTLTLHQCTERGEVDDSATPVLKADITDSLAQSVHEYVYRDFVLSLSTQQGHTHFLQATNHSDVDAWVEAIHRAGALGSTTEDSREDAIDVLQDRCGKLQQQVETQGQMKQMASLQLKNVSGKVKSKISEQISSWSEEIEGFNVDIYKWKCYIAALKGSELPNPQSLLACATKATKASLRGQVANFSVSAFHSLVTARRAAKGNMQRSGSKQKKTGPEPDIVPLRKSTDDKTPAGASSPQLEATDLQGTSERQSLRPLDLSTENESGSVATDNGHDSEASNSVEGTTPMEVAAGQPVWQALVEPSQQQPPSRVHSPPPPQLLRIELPDKQSSVIALQDGMTAGDVLDITCEKRNLDPDASFLVLGINKADGVVEYRLANLDLAMKEMMYDIVEVREKQVHTIHLALPDTRTLGSLSVVFGFEVDICEGAALGQPSVFVTEVLPSSVAHTAGLLVGDEILSINSEVVEDQSRSHIIELLQAAVLSMVVRSCQGTFSAAPEMNIIDELVCPAPPIFDDLTDMTLEELMVPKPPGEDSVDGVGEGQEDNFAEVETEQIDKFLQNIEELNAFLLTLQYEAPPVAVTPSTGQALSKEKRLALCAQELVDTERVYIKKLSILLDRYLEPLRFETFLPKDKFELIFGNIRDVLTFQRQFLQDLEDAMKHISADADKESVQSLRMMIFSLSGSVLFYMRRFKMYSSFCVSHMEANVFLNKPESVANEQLQEFLRVRNPKRDSSMSLSALLIMPILRLMRYPLFLETMRSLTSRDSAEYQRLTEAKSGMEHMADYINEIQRVNDRFGVLFHELLAECAFTEPWLSASLNELGHHLEVMWLNANQSLMHGHSWKKGVGPKIWCFVFKSVVILLCDEQRNRRKSTKNLADAPAMHQTVCSMDDLQFWTVLRTSRAKVVDLPDSDGVTGMWQVVDKSTQPATSYLFRTTDAMEKQTTLSTIRQVIRDRGNALTALTPGTARRRANPRSGVTGGGDGVNTQQLSITSYARHHEASTSTRVISPDTEDMSGVLNRSAQLRTSNRRRRASECGRTAEAAAAAAANASENYFATDEMAC